MVYAEVRLPWLALPALPLAHWNLEVPIMATNNDRSGKAIAWIIGIIIFIIIARSIGSAAPHGHSPNPDDYPQTCFEAPYGETAC